jgi:DNA primase
MRLRELRALCPFIVRRCRRSTSTRRGNPFIAGCGSGSVFCFVMDYEHIDFPASVRLLAARAGTPVVEEQGGA